MPDHLNENNLTAGVDEAGRGAWAGPVVAAAVMLNPDKPIIGLADSKKLLAKKREELACIIKSSALCWSVAAAEAWEIDHLNILQATLLAMQRAVAGLHPMPERVLVDGNQIPTLSMPVQAIIKGDNLVPSISAASIIAKVERDHIMSRYRQEYPDFAFHQHKGYGTALHTAELARSGVLAIHRKSFAPIKKRCQT